MSQCHCASVVGVLSVESFLYDACSGMLVMFWTLRRVDSGGGSLSLIKFYVHRFLRSVSCSTSTGSLEGSCCAAMLALSSLILWPVVLSMLPLCLCYKILLRELFCHQNCCFSGFMFTFPVHDYYP